MTGKETTLYAGLTIALLGATVLIAPTFGFSTVSLERLAGLDAAADDAALVGFEETAADLEHETDQATVLRLRNNAEEELTLATTVLTSPTELGVVDDGAATLQPGEASEVTVDCGTLDAEEDASVAVTVEEASGGTLSIRDATDTATLLADCGPDRITDPASSETVATDRYVVENVESGLVLAVADGSTAENATVQQDGDDGADHQRWLLDHRGDGQYRLEPDHSGMAAGVANATRAIGGNLTQQDWNGSDHQLWHVESVVDGEYRLVANHSGLVAAVPNGSLDAGTGIEQAEWTNESHQRWRLQPESPTLTWETDADWSAGTSNRTVSDDVGDRENDTVRLGYDPTASGLVGYWPLDEDGGSTAVDAAGSNDGDHQNDPTIGATGLLSSTAYDFDGSSSHVRVPADSSLEMSTEDRVTVSAWINPDSVDTDGYTAIAQKSDESYNLQLVDGAPAFTVYDPDVGEGWHEADGNDVVSTGEWTHVVGTFDGDTARIYVDGTEEGTNSDPTKIDDSSGVDLGIGENVDNTGRHFDGRIEEVRIYDRALSATEVANRTRTAEDGTHVTGWKTAPVDLAADRLRLEDVSTTLDGEDATVRVETDLDGDGSADETSDPIALADGTDAHDVTGVDTDADTFRLRANLSTADETVTPVLDRAAVSATDPEPAFDVTIDGTNEPVEEGEALTVDATVTNDGDGDGTQDVTLSTDDSQRDAASVYLEAGEHTTVTLEWATGDGDVGIYDATVESDDDGDVTAVAVVRPNGPIWETDADWSAGTQNRTVSDDVGDRVNDTARLGYPADATNLVGYWPLDEDAGSTAYDAAGSNDGDHVGDGVTVSRPGLLNTTGYGFDGTSLVNVTHDESLGFDADLAVSAWLRTESLGTSDHAENQSYFVQKSTYETDGYALFDNGDYGDEDGVDEIVFRVNEDGAHHDVGFDRDPVNDGDWHHLVGVRDGDEIRIYLDGELRDSATGTGLDPNTDPLGIGATSGDTAHYEGDLEEVRLYDGALSDAQVQSLAATTENGTHTTDWQPTGDPLDTSSLRLENVSATLGPANATVYVESDVDHDGTVDETSDPVALEDGADQFSVTGLSTDPDRVRLRVEFETPDVAATPIVSRIAVGEGPNYRVEIDDTDSPVTEGETLSVNATVENAGTETGNQSVELRDFDGAVVDETQVELAPDENASVALEWATAAGDNGTANVTVASEDDADEREVWIRADGPYVDVTIDDTNAPVEEGEELDVNVTAENVGDESATQAIELAAFNGTVVDQVDVTLASGEVNDSITLTWNTSVGDAGTDDVTVHSENDSATATVTVESSLGPGDLHVDDVGADVDPGSETQEIRYVVASDAEDDLRIELGEAQDDGVDYEASGSEPSITIEGGDVTYENWVDENWLYGLHFTLDSPSAGDEIVVTLGDYSTQSSGGPWTVEIWDNDEGTLDTDEFEVES